MHSPIAASAAAAASTAAPAPAAAAAGPRTTERGDRTASPRGASRPAAGPPPKSSPGAGAGAGAPLATADLEAKLKSLQGTVANESVRARQAAEERKALLETVGGSLCVLGRCSHAACPPRCAQVKAAGEAQASAEARAAAAEARGTRADARTIETAATCVRACVRAIRATKTRAIRECIFSMRALRARVSALEEEVAGAPYERVDELEGAVRVATAGGARMRRAVDALGQLCGGVLDELESRDGDVQLHLPLRQRHAELVASFTADHTEASAVTADLSSRASELDFRCAEARSAGLHAHITLRRRPGTGTGAGKALAAAAASGAGGAGAGAGAVGGGGGGGGGGGSSSGGAAGAGAGGAGHGRSDHDTIADLRVQLTLARVAAKRATLLNVSLKASRDALAMALSRLGAMEHELARTREQLEAVASKKTDAESRARFFEQQALGLREQLSSLRARTAADDVSREQQHQHQHQQQQMATSGPLSLSGGVGGAQQLSLSGRAASVSPARAPASTPAAAAADGEPLQERSRMEAATGGGGEAASGGEDEGGSPPRQSFMQLVRALHVDGGARALVWIQIDDARGLVSARYHAVITPLSRRCWQRVEGSARGCRAGAAR